MKKTGLMLFGVLLVAAGGFFVWQQRVVSRLQSENQTLRRLTDELQPMREENARLAKERIDPAELERLRAGQSELVRLRGQVAQLRRQVSEMAGKRPAPGLETSPPAAVEASAPSVETFTATAHAVVQWKQTLITGGWTLPSGKRGLVLVQPESVEEDVLGDVPAGTRATIIVLRTRIIEMPDSGFAQFGFDGMRTDRKLSSFTGMLTTEQADSFIMALEKMEGASVLSAPSVATADGRQAQVKVADVRTAPSGEQYELGPTLDLVPKISDDRSSVLLHVNAQLRLPAAPAK